MSLDWKVHLLRFVQNKTRIHLPFEQTANMANIDQLKITQQILLYDFPQKFIKIYRFQGWELWSCLFSNHQCKLSSVVPKRSSKELSLKSDVVGRLMTNSVRVCFFICLWIDDIKHVRHFKFKFFNNYVHNTYSYQLSAKVLLWISFYTSIYLLTVLIRHIRIH